MNQLIFDFDGTLVDSMGAWAGKMIHILDRYGVAYPADIVKIITPLGDRGTAEYFIRQFGLAKSAEELIAEMDAFAIGPYTYTIPAKVTVPETLCALREQGYRLSVLTASPHRMLDVCLKRLGLYDLFDHVWSCDDFGTTKSDPGIYEAAADRLQTDLSDCVFLDDNIHALATAKRAGMQVVGVYDETSADLRPEIEALCAGYMERMEELIPWLAEPRP